MRQADRRSGWMARFFSPKTLKSLDTEALGAAGRLSLKQFALLHVRNSWMIQRPGTRRGPEELAVSCRYGDIVDACLPAHQAVVVEFPEFVAVTAEPLARVIMPFVLEAHGDATVVEGP